MHKLNIWKKTNFFKSETRNNVWHLIYICQKSKQIWQKDDKKILALNKINNLNSYLITMKMVIRKIIIIITILKNIK